MKINGIRHIRTAPFHPSTNGMAERSVGTLKQCIRAAGDDFDLNDFLIANRSTVQATTGRTPSELMMGRPLRTKLSLLRPNLSEDVEDKQDAMVR